MLWRYVLSCALPENEAKQFGKFQMQWLQAAVLPFPQHFADHLPGWVTRGKIWPLQRLLEVQAEYRSKIESNLPSEVPEGERQMVAQGVLEAFVFAGGLSVPSTIHAAVSMMFASPELFAPTQAEIVQNLDAFVYEVTRMFPAVQGFCYWADGNREILSLNAALRDPAVWGSDANRFTLKPLELYRQNHVGFASQAKGTPGSFDSKGCPGQQLTLDVVKAWVLILSDWQPQDPERPQARTYWSPNRRPKAEGVQKRWWRDFQMSFQDWLDGDQTGEMLLREQGPLAVARLHGKVSIEKDGGESLCDRIIWSFAPKAGKGAGRKIVKLNKSTRFFFELSRKRFKELSKRTNVEKADLNPAKKSKAYFDLEMDGKTDLIRLPQKEGMKTWLRAKLAGVFTDITALDDNLPEDIEVGSDFAIRLGLIVLGQELYYRKTSAGSLELPPNSSARSDSYLPKAKSPFGDITLDSSQVAIARCGMGQFYLKRNRNPRLAQYGDIVCDVSALEHCEVRPAFEKLGATAVFRQCPGGSWDLTAIDWRHQDTVVTPGHASWNHAKWVWRCSLIAHMTVVHHLMWAHWMVANAFSTSLRECLSPTHPIRRVLQVCAYNTPNINHNSALSLYPDCGMLHRMSSFTYEALTDIFVGAAESYKFKSWPQELADIDLDDEVKRKLPIYEDGLDLWKALERFYSAYVDVYYPTDAEVVSDAELQEYWKFECVPQYARSLPALSKSALKLHLTRTVFDVTAYHEMVGDVVEYTTDPAGAMLQVREGLDQCDVQQFVQVNSLVAGTGTPMPMFMASGRPGDEDWLHQLDLTVVGGRGASEFEKISVLHKTLMEDLHKVSKLIESRNKPGNGRERPYRQLNPLNHERSVSL
eukprot:TRINITY_DN33985_c0_g1_i1.p1 TRINITY_DN33985_c0_g1~~TRINITY_DN33985_c0_g1_i1.p1  ORF type:complete len:872 (+),score=172.75 TRINITY_DN33985_c0_g1_i1:712-3327(+)